MQGGVIAWRDVAEVFRPRAAELLLTAPRVYDLRGTCPDGNAARRAGGCGVKAPAVLTAFRSSAPSGSP